MIDEVLKQFDAIIERACVENDRIGYFPALYRRVTLTVKAGIDNGRFENGARMEKLVSTFAIRYLDALQNYRNDKQPSRCWKTAFEAAKSWRVLILQHLLLGINAHINLDLGISAAEVCPGSELPSLSKDFDEINEILASLFKKVQREINNVSPLIGWLDRVAGNTDDVLINFSMANARAAAWHFAEKLAMMDAEQRKKEIEQTDRFANLLAHIIWKPGPLFAFVVWFIRLFETKRVVKVIEVLIEKKLR
ncbi:MAG: hypothetical protein HYR76_11780 [Ignavibacteria bacterium]|nr:hypothetical protein [Ignavibacteria bacterium]